MDASGRFNIIDENELLRNHSLVYNHLITNKDILEKEKEIKELNGMLMAEANQYRLLISKN